MGTILKVGAHSKSSGTCMTWTECVQAFLAPSCSALRASFVPVHVGLRMGGQPFTEGTARSRSLVKNAGWWWCGAVKKSGILSPHCAVQRAGPLSHLLPASPP